MVHAEVVMSLHFTIDPRYQLIQVGRRSWDIIEEVDAWCNNKDNGQFIVYGAVGIAYRTEADLTAFLLRWA